MKIAVLSDIHGNYPALLRAAADIDSWRPDQVIVAGDIINRGPRSPACWRYVKERQRSDDWRVIKGNHEDYVLDCAYLTDSEETLSYRIRQYAQWTCRQLAAEVGAIGALPDKYSVTLPGDSEFRVLHGSMRDNRDGIYPKTQDHELRLQIAPPPALFVTAHTHRPLIRSLDETVVVNVGSVGSPFDEDKRLSYGRFTWRSRGGWQAEIVRLAYDWQQTEADYVSSGFLEEGGPLAQLMLVELRKSRGLIYRWASSFEDAVLADEITLEASVREILGQPDVQPYTGPPGWTL